MWYFMMGLWIDGSRKGAGMLLGYARHSSHDNMHVPIECERSNNSVQVCTYGVRWSEGKQKQAGGHLGLAAHKRVGLHVLRCRLEG